MMLPDHFISHYLSPKTALKWYRRLTLAFMLYSWVVFFLAVYSLAAHVNQPYGGFLWSWSNTDGQYRVKYLAHELSGQLDPIDILQGMDGQPSPTNPHQLYRLAEQLYQQRGATVCSANPPNPLPTVTYLVMRANTLIQVPAAIRCYTPATIAWVSLMPIYYAFIFAYLATLFFRSIPLQPSNSTHYLTLTLTILVSLFSIVASFHGADSWGVNGTWGQAFINLWGNNVVYAFFIAFTCHLITIYPLPSPANWFYRVRIIWHLLLPITIIFFSTVCTILSLHWSPTVGNLTIFTGSLNYISYGIIFITAMMRYFYVYQHTSDPQIKAQLKIWQAMCIFFLLIFLSIIKDIGSTLSFLPAFIPFLLNNLFTIIITMPCFVITFTIVRYQTLPNSATFFRVLISTMFAVTLTQIFASLIIVSPANSTLWLFVLLTIYSAFWVTPSLFSIPNTPLQYLQKLMQAETIDTADLKAFSQDIQHMLDLDLLISTTLQSLVTHLELRFAAIWLVKTDHELQLENATDGCPDNLPETLTMWVDQATFCNPKTTPELPTVGQMLLPLMISKQRIGLILISERWTDEIFQTADLAVLDNMLGQQIALALSTAKQFRELRLAPEKIKQAERDERQRIAGDLHDLTQAQLNQLNYTLDKVASLLTTDPAEAQRILQRSQVGVNQAAQDLRAILSELSHETGSTLPVIVILREYVDHAKVIYTHLNFSLEVEPLVDKLLATPKKSALLRVCRQSLDNALAHAQAKTIKFVIQLNPQHNIVEFAIIDDGRGFAERPFGELLKEGHRGLHRMSLWLLQYNGHVEIKSSPGQGTVIKGYLPI